MTAMNGSTPRGAVLFRLEYQGASPADTLNLWLGVGDFEVPANDLMVGAEMFHGIGALAGVPVLDQLINGAYSRGDFTLNAVPAEIALLTNASADEIRNAPVNVGMIELDEDWQVAGDVLWTWDGTADVLRTGRSADPGASQSHTVTLSVASAMSARKRPTLEFWTDAQQRRRSPTDLGLERMATTEQTKKWPN